MVAISVIIPCYNQDKYIAECLDSVIAQTFTDFEAVIVNDGSTDNSSKIINEYKVKDNRIKVINQENQGLSGARNTGLKRAAGEYVCFLDSDDTYDANFLQNLYQEAKKSDADVVMTNTRYLQPDKVCIDGLKQQIITDFSEKVAVLPHGGACNKIYKMKFIKEHELHFPQGFYFEDNIFTVKTCFYSNKLSVINKTSYNYMCNPQSITRAPQNEAKRARDGVSIAKMIMDFALKQNCSVKEKETLSDFCIKNFVDFKRIPQMELDKAKEILLPTPLFKKNLRKRRKKMLKNKLYMLMASISGYIGRRHG